MDLFFSPALNTKSKTMDADMIKQTPIKMNTASRPNRSAIYPDTAAAVDPTPKVRKKRMPYPNPCLCGGR